MRSRSAVSSPPLSRTRCSRRVRMPKRASTLPQRRAAAFVFGRHAGRGQALGPDVGGVGVTQRVAGEARPELRLEVDPRGPFADI